MLVNTGQKTYHKQDTKKLITTQKKQTTQNTETQNEPGLVISNDTRPENEVGIFYNAPKPTKYRKIKLIITYANAQCYYSEQK